MPPSIRTHAQPYRRPGTPPAAETICSRVAAVVAQDFAVERAMLFARTRGSPRDALARQTAMYLAHIVFAVSFGQIGRIYGRDRTTVAHACRRIEDARDGSGFDERLRQLEMHCRRPRSGDGRMSRVSLTVIR